MSRQNTHSVKEKRDKRVPDFCGERLVASAAPCVRPRGHRGLHVPVTHEDAPSYVADWRADTTGQEGT
jgi:hypothetical protein